MNPSRWLVGLLSGIVAVSPFHKLNAAPARVDVILWFDTEDYLSLADDDACKRLAEMLTERNIRATFKVVGEKARVLERRGRRDVIEALQRHDIGYHANFHSVHPTPTEYLADSGWLDGIAEFERREGGGAEDVRRIFQKKTLVCYGQPGSSWAPQAIAALKGIGVAPDGTPCYVDEGEHVGLNNQPFWYAGALNVFHMGPNYTRMELHDPAAVEPAKEKVSEIARRLQSQEGGGLISIFYHPCEWIHKQFWDGVNFSRGANPPPEMWKAPPQQPPAETEAAFGRFAQYIDHIRAIPGVRFVAAGDLPRIYSDPLRNVGAPPSDLKQIAERLAPGACKGIDFLTFDQRSYSPADQFELLAQVLVQLIANEKPRFPLIAHGLLGPDSGSASGTQKRQLAWSDFRRAVMDVADFIHTQGRVPSRIFIGPDPITPTVFLAAMADAYRSCLSSGKLPVQAGVTLPEHLELLTVSHVAEDKPELFGGWIIHKENFQAPKVMEQARLQAWTLKPAIRAEK